MKCAFCGGMLEEKVVTFTYEEGDKYLFVEHVPALACNKCGERIYSPEVTDKPKEIKVAEKRMKDYLSRKEGGTI